MKQTVLYSLWGFFWIICGLLGYNAQPTGAQAAAMIVLGLCTFVPGALLLAEGLKTHNRRQVRTVRWISLGSLAVTAVLFVANILCVAAPEGVAALFNGLLIFLSAPMMCLRFYPLSLFLWACLLVASFRKEQQ